MNLNTFFDKAETKKLTGTSSNSTFSMADIHRN